MNGTEKKMTSFTSSFRSDYRLFAADIRCSIAYCDGLFHAGILTRLEAEKIKNGLATLLKRADFDRNYFAESDAGCVHSFIETKLIQLVGETGAKLQTGRSRSEQFSTALRLWLRQEIEEISKLAANLQKKIIQAAERQKEAVLPAYANRRKAQTILWAHRCLAFFEMFARDRERLDEVWRRTNILPLGSAYAAGTNYEIDREAIAAALGFEGVTANSLDAISDQDFLIEFAGASALLMIHLVRLSDDLILYASDEFGFIDLNDKKNLLALELVGGKAGKILGHQTALITTLKGSPLGFSKNLQMDAEAVFDCADTVKSCLQAAGVVFESLRVNKEKTQQAAMENYLNATELTDYFVQKGVSFRTAQDLTEKIISHAISQNQELNELDLDDFRQFSEEIDEGVFAFLSLEQSLARKNQIGGTAPERVFEALQEARQSLENE